MAGKARLRQAVVVVHGMGEQRPLDMLNNFIDAAIPGTTRVVHGTDLPVYYSRPIPDSDAYEARVYLARETENYLQTEFYEYHWSYMMQGNRLSDLTDTFVRLLWQFPWKVPSGLRVVWCLFWLLLAAALWMIATLEIGIGKNLVAELAVTLVGGGAVGTVLVWLITKAIPGKITSSFVDVTRYLDTAPRSYGVRKQIRKGMVDFLKSLHDINRYDRIIVVAHSLGAYIAYDGITYLWSQMNQEHLDGMPGSMDLERFKTLEAEARKLSDGTQTDPASFRARQRDLWAEMRRHGCPWLISDFVSVGTPMYMADQLMTKTREAFDDKVERRDIATCPPKPDLPGSKPGRTLYSYPYKGSRVLYHAAPFAVTRWSNMWFPAHYSFFGDWFAGPLSPLFGKGIKDVPLAGNGWKRFLPAWAHTLYFSFPDDESPTSATHVLHEFMDLKGGGWLSRPGPDIAADTDQTRAEPGPTVKADQRGHA